MSAGGRQSRSPLATFRTISPLLPLMALTRANLLLLARNRQVVVFNILVPLLLIVIFGGLFQSKRSPVDVVAPAPDAAILKQALPHSSFNVRVVSAAAARRQVLNNSADFALVITGTGKPLHARIEENAGNITENAAFAAAAQGALYSLNQQLLRTAPAVIPSVDELHPKGGLSAGSLANANYIYFLTPGILAYAVLTAGLGAGIRLVGDRERGTLRRIRATPMPVWAFLASSVLAQLVLVAVQIAVLLGVGHLMYGVGLGPSPGPVLLMLLVGSLCFLAGGFLIAGFARREQSAVVLMNLVTLPQLFVAGIFYPIATAPIWLRDLATVMPLTYFSNGLRGLMAQAQRLSQVLSPDLLVLLGVGTAVLLLAARIFRFEPASAGS
ncbi:MAG TPA: ABC transporter permease [Candidatus Saccharimonadales bacterium]|nr:ABC transporter permease [Candidatus Saccharimonadales bacterium]